MFPAGSHDPITYPAALVTGAAAKPAAAGFFAELKGDAAQKIFADEGFSQPPAAN